jgi:hypothetical protein
LFPRLKVVFLLVPDVLLFIVDGQCAANTIT